jgi:DNA-directed RNA polymerase subunit E'/Rpb7
MAAGVRTMSLFKPVYLDQRIALAPTEFRTAADGLDEFLVKKIRKNLEGQCCTHGYVRPGSTQILARSMGQAEHGRFTGDFLFNCKVKVMCLLPTADQIVTGRILKMNKLGGYALIVDDGQLREAMRILLPRDMHRDNLEFDNLQVGQGVKIRLLKSRFQANDAFIQAVGTYEGAEPAADAKGEEEAKAEAADMLKPAVAPTDAGSPTAPAAGPSLTVQEQQEEDQQEEEAGGESKEPF